MLKAKCADGHAVAGRKPKLTAQQADQVFELKSLGYSYRAIGAELGVSYATVSRVLKEQLVDRSRPDL